MGNWSVQLCDCMSNPVMFLWACCVPGGWCCMQAINAKLTEDDKNAWIIAYCLDCCLGCIGGIVNRHRLRRALEVKDTIIIDILFWCYLPCCAVTQEYMETLEKKKGNRKLPIWEVYKDR